MSTSADPGEDLTERLDALAHAVELGERRLPDAVLADGRDVVERARRRLAVSTSHTVVALAGATGSGKSSLFNALSGLEVSAVGPRRPTTSAVHACVWGADDAQELLDWLDVPGRFRLSRATVLDDAGPTALDGLVLLDLPDQDSTEAGHRLETDRLVERVDRLVWVVDPQKYADRVMHEDYLRQTASGIVVVALNQTDRLTPEEVAACESDLRRLLAEDGLGEARVVTTSAVTPSGADSLRRVLEETVRDDHGAAGRISAEVRSACERLGAYCGPRETRAIDSGLRDELVDPVAAAAGIPALVTSLAKATRRRGMRCTEWPPLVLAKGRDGVAASRLQLDDEIGRWVYEPELTPAPVQRAPVDQAVRRMAVSAADGLPAPWPAVIARRAAADSEEFAAALDQSLGEGRVDPVSVPPWWRLVQVVQWLLLVVAGLAVLWLIAVLLGGLAGWQLPGGFDGYVLPASVAVGALVAGPVLAALMVPCVRATARHRAGAVQARLRDEIAHLGRRRVLDRIDGELDTYAEFCRELALARGPDTASARP
ncbi:MAG: GTPase family protein [Streptosporangiales bacterium]